LRDKALSRRGELKGPSRDAVKGELAILTGLHFPNRGFLFAPDLHAGASDTVAVLIDDPTAYRAVAFFFGRRPAR
jgi:hypothetical protein